MDLISEMTKKLRLCENQLILVNKKLSTSEEKLKENKMIIAELKKKLEDKVLESLQNVPQLIRKSSKYVQHLESKCRNLQTQVMEMEKFLADYGLRWVGENESEYCRSEEHTSGEHASEDNISATVKTPDIDFNVLMTNIANLNELAGSGTLHISHTPQGAVFMRPKNVPITFYGNGFVFASESFCKYSEPRGEQFIKDIMDGFFPSELEMVYPEGVIFQISDKHHQFYEDKDDIWKPFTGKGYRLGSSKELKKS